ncbi:hypothetical protein CDD80_5266 [Ophiocordyceps camponoti-rufipedis]|uniref:Peptidase S8/S53 domain-containing protein n=1 Tax=Ophiocordyceps camponoti-rufipedis TaxID=2004952 RepID=A0A2C5ZJ74_9HYPO|nr:hypothetical protein CDD80_5266 [Ophiocordyceps camponoti-rufipedis]
MVDEADMALGKPAPVYQTNWRKLTAQPAEKRLRLDGPQLKRWDILQKVGAIQQLNATTETKTNSHPIKGDYPRVKVCVIDAGFHPADKNRARILAYKDFAEPEREDLVDNAERHGTNSANLVLAVYDECELFVARIFRTGRTDGRTEPELMAQAIEWAISPSQNVDIISISAGFHTHSPRLEAAVQKASAANKLILAAAGNQGNLGPVMFPARHSLHTICIFATDTVSKAAGFNPESRNYAHNFAVLGEGFADPKDWRSRLSGTSLATAAASGMAAFVVDFSRQADNRAIFRVDDVSRLAGMIAVFEAISRPSGLFKCVALPNLLPDSFDEGVLSREAMRDYARQTISRAMERAN